MNASMTYNDWKSRLIIALIMHGVKKKKAKKISDSYYDEYGMGIIPESLADSIVNSPDDE